MKIYTKKENSVDDDQEQRIKVSGNLIEIYEDNQVPFYGSLRQFKQKKRLQYGKY